MFKKVISAMTAIIISLASTAYATDIGYYHNDLDFDFKSKELDMHSTGVLPTGGRATDPIRVSNETVFSATNKNVGSVLAITNFKSVNENSANKVTTIAIGAQTSLEGSLKGGYYSTDNMNFGNVAAISNIDSLNDKRTIATTTAVGAITNIDVGIK